LLLLMGIVELGRIFHAYMVVNEAARDAVRYVSVSASDERVREVIEQDSQTLDESRVEYVVTPAAGSRESGQPITVQVRYPVELITPILNRVLPNPVTVTSTMTMRKE
ncbi:MAG TPA: TadE family protein, partial [Bacilli bacterium]|nr:TadE family protein [Bacilli bacterium]